MLKAEGEHMSEAISSETEKAGKVRDTRHFKAFRL